MKFDSRTIRKSLNKSFLKEPIDRTQFNAFKYAFEQLLDHMDAATIRGEHEEHFKNFLKPFFQSNGFKDFYINTSARIDLAIHNGSRGKDSVGAIIEVKRPSNKAEMITTDQLNRKAMHEAVLYYLDQRIEEGNTDLKHVIITNMDNWFIFDAHEFERCFYKPSALRKIWQAWKANQKVSPTNDFMYREISRFMDEQETSITGAYLSLAKFRKYLKSEKASEQEKKLIPLFKFLTPIHLLKQPFANDSNSLNREFYRELLYILGLEEIKEGSTRFIRRVKKENRNSGAIIENTLRILESEGHLTSVREPLTNYGSNSKEQRFNLAMELVIVWMNRILFLKLLEAQLFTYHRQDQKFKFLNFQTIDQFDELNKVFFRVLARKPEERSEDIVEKYGHIPYLNSSLFDLSSLERQTTRISGLDDRTEIPVYNRSVLVKSRGKVLNTLDYLFRFLDAYDFAVEGTEEIRDERKSLINASVLGLIFEKINGYKDGSFYTPGFVTEYMARETLQKAVIDAFNDRYNWQCSDFDELYNQIHRERLPLVDANRVINDLRICDPAVGSGHFLVSCLNELIAIKSRLDVLCDSDGKILRQVQVEVENDELIVSWEDEELFEYGVSHNWSGQKLTSRSVAPHLDRVQKALFNEKRYLIENCLFGVDINQNSVKICRLRLWIELLKRAYYTSESNYLDLEVMPNIDINIKKGNSLVSRFDLDTNLDTVFKNSKHSLKDYKQAVRDYKRTGDRIEKHHLQNLIDQIKDEYETSLFNNRPINKKLSRERGKLQGMLNADLFGEIKVTKKDIATQKKKVQRLEKKKADEEIGVFFNQAFEWRFEFPEVLDDEGNFIGFDVVIGNPPYIRQEQLREWKPYFQRTYKVYQGTADLYSYFIELGVNLLRERGFFHYIVANKWMRANYGKELRSWIQKEVKINAIYDFGDLPVFEEATTYPCLLQLQKIKEPGLFQAVEIETLDFDRLEDYLEDHRFEVDQSRLLSGGWTLITKEAQRLLDKIRSKGIPLGEYVDGKIYRGVLTGLNEAFVIDEQTRERLIQEDSNSAELIKPFLAGRDIKRYQTPNAVKHLILIPNGWTDEQTEQEDKWQWFSNVYPAIAEHLVQYEEKARKRYDQGKYWWELRACDYYEEFEKPKMLLPDIALRGNFTMDQNGGIYVVNTAYIIGSDEKFLLGILASNLIDFYYRSISASYRGGYLRFIYQYLETTPIREPYNETRIEMESKVRQILETPEADTTCLEEEIDQLVYELYGLNEDEIRLVNDLYPN